MDGRASLDRQKTKEISTNAHEHTEAARQSLILEHESLGLNSHQLSYFFVSKNPSSMDAVEESTSFSSNRSIATRKFS